MIRFSSFSIDRKHFWDAKSVSSVNFRYKIHRGRIILCHREDFLRSFREFSRSFNVIIFTLNTRRFILHEEKDDFLEWISNNFFFFFRKNITFGLLTIFFLTRIFNRNGRHRRSFNPAVSQNSHHAFSLTR